MILSLQLANPVAAHQALLNTVWPCIKSHLMAGNRIDLALSYHEDRLTNSQRAYYHGYILTEIARQAVVAGRRHAMPVWKEFLRAKFLGFKTRSYTCPMTGRRIRRRERVSTEDLGVRGYNQLIEQVTAFAVTELGVRFEVDFEEWTDPDTGEILQRRAA